MAERIEWWDDPDVDTLGAKGFNARYYRHLGCSEGDQSWMVPQDGAPPPEREDDECPRCCQVLPLVPREPEKVPHYSGNSSHPVLFYGGRFSSFAKMPFLARPMFLDIKPLTFPTREHWFQAHKTLNRVEFGAITEIDPRKPGTAKARGRKISPLILGWDDGVAFAVMVEGIRLQCHQYPALADQLLATGDRWIAEDSPSDYTWGARDSMGGWSGRNLLGEAWMRVRRELKAKNA